MKSSYRFLVFAILLIAFSVVGYSTPTITEKSETKFNIHQMDVNLENVVINDLFNFTLQSNTIAFSNIENNKSILEDFNVKIEKEKFIYRYRKTNYRYYDQINYNSTYKLARDLTFYS